VTLRAAPAGTGIIAGGPMRAVFETLGIKDIVAKSVGTSNPHNMIKATFERCRSSTRRAWSHPARQEGRRPFRPPRRDRRRGGGLGSRLLANGKKIKITQTGSHIGRTEDQRGTLIGLGLNKRHRSANSQIRPRCAA